MALRYISRRAKWLKISSTSIFEKSGRKITQSPRKSEELANLIWQ